jgi:hypothetical protein
VKSLNEVYSSLSARRRYEVWFVRLGLANGSGAFWFRYLLTNPARGGCPENPLGKPVRVWATWFPRGGTPQNLIQGFDLNRLALSSRGEHPFHFGTGDCEIGENSCRGLVEGNGHRLSWNLQYRSHFRATLSDKGWIGFSRTPHSDAAFSGEIMSDGRRLAGDPLGFGLQGHNCGYRHRGFWRWAHAYFPQPDGQASTLEALVYDMPLGLIFRKAVLWHAGKQHVFRNLKEQSDSNFRWNFRAAARDLRLSAAFNGTGPSMHRLPYLKTDCSGSFEVKNNSLAIATIRVERPDGMIEELETTGGAVLEMTGDCD